MKRLLLLLLSLLLVLDARGQQPLPPQTIVIFNSASPESVSLAKFYAEKRGIPRDHLVPLDCSTQEEISREEYDSMIADPVRQAFDEHGWWKVHDTDDGRKRVDALAIHFVALIKGVPLKIRATADYPGDNPGPGPMQNRNEASVDSELSALPLFTQQISGAVTNRYFQSYKPIADFSEMPLLLVTRLDGPDVLTVRRMITDAIATEKNGLWGRAYVDAAHNTNPGFQVGDQWMANIVEQLHKVGVPVVYEDTPAIFPDGYPMSDCALYYGWYAGNIAGPFNQPGFKFVPGAIAAHIHSFSASTLRDPNTGWAGPLLARGAAATVGNVYEPYLELTAHLDILNDRLLHGFTFAESTYMASRVLSWMNVSLGDPLYRPYYNWTQVDSKTPPGRNTAQWRSYHDFAVKNYSAPDFRALARTFAARTKNGPMTEDLALMELRDKNLALAISELQQARAEYSKRDDIVRCVLEECDALEQSGKGKRAAELAHMVLRIVPDAPATPLLQKIISDAAPKPPPTPTPTP
ncbi:MAG: TIGR03790 family protein [Verrucomicrobia bacterium]|nr:TIGR03790 family protein [Verrucomicrobiota bacterium]